MNWLIKWNSRHTTPIQWGMANGLGVTPRVVRRRATLFLIFSVEDGSTTRRPVFEVEHIMEIHQQELHAVTHLAPSQTNGEAWPSQILIASSTV